MTEKNLNPSAPRRKPLLVVSTGAGISAESGLSTFRDADGLWENYPVMDVASADGFRRNPELVHRFYNERRAQLRNARPNEAHKALADLEKDFDVRIITQNVDDLHERAGSSSVLHLHGELMKMRAVDDPDDIEPIDPANPVTTPLTRGAKGNLMRPHIVFFQEAVPNIEPAAELAAQADIFVVIGTSLVVYPAAGLLYQVKPGTPVWYIDPRPALVTGVPGLQVIAQPATKGVTELARRLSADLK